MMAKTVSASISGAEVNLPPVFLPNHDDMRVLASDDSKSTSAVLPCKSAIVGPKLRRREEVNLFAHSDVAMERR